MVDVHIDFETRSRAEIKSCGLSKYAQDPSTEILCMAYAAGDSEVRIWRPGERDFPLDLTQCRVHAHNAAFEIAILKHILHQNIPIGNFCCTAARSAYAGLPRSLGQAGATLGLPSDAQKDKEGHKLMLQLCKPNSQGEFDNSPEKIARLEQYCRQDVEAERALTKVLPPLPDAEQENWCYDRIVNERGVPVDRSLCEGAVQILQDAMQRAQEMVIELSNGQIKTGGQVKKILDYVNERGVNIDNLRAETVEEALSDAPAGAAAMLELRQSVASAAAKKYAAALARLEGDDRIRETYLYYGAHSGRRSSPGLQIQNLCVGFRGEIPQSVISTIAYGSLGLLESMFDESAIGLLGRAVRAIICAPPGKRIVLADITQAEVRIAHWLAGSPMMKAFREGVDPYIEFAKGFFGVSTVTKEQRQHGKCSVLGLGYGMGAARLVGYAKNYGLQITPADAKRAVEYYRKSQAAIVVLWRNLERAAIQATRSGREVPLGRLCFATHKKWLTLRLPSGRQLYYFDPLVETEGHNTQLSYTGTRGNRERIWGGTWLENICQAVTRDLCVAAQVRCEKAGLPVILDQHDEIGIECDERDAAEAERELCAIISDAPDWADGLPVGADGRIRKRFEK